MSGVTTMTTSLIDGLAAHGHSVALVCAELGEAHRGKLAEHVWHYGYDARFSSLFEREGTFRRELARTWYAHRAGDSQNEVYEQIGQSLQDFADEFRPDIVNTHNLNATTAWIRLKIRNKVKCKIIPTIHDVAIDQIRLMAAHADLLEAVVCVSTPVAHQLHRAGFPRGKLTVIPSAVDVERFEEKEHAHRRWASLSAELDLPDDLGLVGLVPCRRVPEKGILAGVDAFTTYCRTRRTSGLLMISGSGMGLRSYEALLRDRLSEISGAVGPTTIVLLPPMAYEDMPALYHASDVILTLSRHQEGLGLANLEAMASGSPVVVSSATGGSRSYIRSDVNALTCRPDDERSVVEALDRVRPESRAMTGEGRRTAGRFRQEFMVDAYEGLFDVIDRRT